MVQIVSYILFTLFVTLFVCAVLQLTGKNKSRVSNLMALFYFLLAYLFFYFWFFRIGAVRTVFFLLHSDIAATLAIGPAAYAYIKSITGEQTGTVRWFLFIPAFLSLCLTITCSFWRGVPAVVWQGMYPDYFSDPVIYFLSIFADLWFFVFIVLVAKKCFTLMRMEKFPRVREFRFIFIIFSGAIISTLLLFPAHVLRNGSFIGPAALTNGTLSVLYFFFSYRHPELTQRVIKCRHTQAAALPERVNLTAILARLTALIETEKVYRDPDMDLQSLSNSLGVSSSHLSSVLNEKLGVNFRTFINRYRLDEARELLVTQPEKPILEIAFSVGFNSKTSFNTLFVKETGTSPREYRKKFR
jgi:AraC-like DNA-binding protein